jgi:hypothetical protein
MKQSNTLRMSFQNHEIITPQECSHQDQNQTQLRRDRTRTVRVLQ